MSFIRLHAVVEGQTEEGFVNRVLAPELAAFGIYVDVHRITTGRRHGQTHRGGFVEYDHLARDLLLWMKQDDAEESWFTTMIDLYRLPNEFPGRRDVPAGTSGRDRIERLEDALGRDIARRLGGKRVAHRFIPYLQLHEFEALLFSRPAAFAEAFPGNSSLVDALAAIRAAVETPEEIDDGPQTAPSERILALAGDYQKPVAGLLIAERIGLAAMREACPHFDALVGRLASLADVGAEPSTDPTAPKSQP